MYGSASASVQFDSSFKRENTDTRLIRELRQEIVQLGGVYRGNSKAHRK